LLLLDAYSAKWFAATTNMVVSRNNAEVTMIADHLCCLTYFMGYFQEITVSTVSAFIMWKVSRMLVNRHWKKYFEFKK